MSVLKMNNTSEEAEFTLEDIFISKTDKKGIINFGKQVLLKYLSIPLKNYWVGHIISSDTHICLGVFLNYFGNI